MIKDNDFHFDNIKPNRQTFDSKKINFIDKNDLLENEEKIQTVSFAKKATLFFSVLTISFITFISFNLVKHSHNEKKNNISNTIEIKVKRGKIIDKNNEIIATSLDTKDLYLDIKKSLDKNKLKLNLSEIFSNKEKNFFEKVFQKNQYILIKKDLSLSEINKLELIGDPAIKLHSSSKRIYPQHNIFSHIAGLKTNNISSKLEKNQNNELSKGKDLQLTIDLRIQNIVRDELLNSMIKYEAKSALATVMNVNNGEILSMVSLPDFNPNYPSSILPKTENNLATEARYEMGSTLKIFNAAIAYESDSSSQVQRFEISKGYQITNDKNIKDDHIKNNSLSFDEVFIKSSNVGSVKILESLGFDSQRNFFEKVGLMDKLDVDGLNIVSNKLPNSWNAHSKFISYGYGISLSPISLITSFCSLVNGGYKINPKVLKSNKSLKKQKILSQETSRKIKILIQKIVNEGTGKLALVEGLRVGGKTGTSKKVERGNYSEQKVITSFIGVFPANNPEYLTFVLFDEPGKNINDSYENTGGNTAAPTFSEIVRKISPILSPIIVSINEEN